MWNYKQAALEFRDLCLIFFVAGVGDKKRQSLEGRFEYQTLRIDFHFLHSFYFKIPNATS